MHSHMARRAYRWLTAFAAVFVAISTIVALPQSARAAERLNHKYSVPDTNYPVPQSNALWVSPDGNDSANGSEKAPFKTIKHAAKQAKKGTTIVLKSGVYREPHFSIAQDDVTLQAAPHAEVWLKGSDVVGASRWKKDGKVWKVTGDFQNFCHVCTTNAKPSVEGIAAFPEQVFIGDQPLKQVDSKDKVGPGTFYVEDSTPTTLKSANGTSKQYNVGRQDNITYYVGSDPTAGTTEISERSRAFTATGRHFAMKGVNVAQFSPNQVWDFKDPRLGSESGPVAVSINGADSVIQDSTFAQSATSSFFFNHAENGRFVNNKVLDNGGAGMGGNYSHNLTIENSEFSGNNAEGFLTNGSLCTAYCGIADVKITHAKSVTFRGNKVDYSQKKVNHTDKNNKMPTAFWCDEGCIGTATVNNFFTNVGQAVGYEVSSGGVIASNIIESSGAGINVMGSDKVKIYNNTISRTFRPINIGEDKRAKGCNAYDTNKKCISGEKWSQSQKLSWDTTGTQLYNNIISSRLTVQNDSSGPYWAYPIRTIGADNLDGSAKLYSNDLFEGMDYDAFYRSSPQAEPYVLTWDLKDKPDPVNILFSRTSEIASNPAVNKKIDGLERHALDQFGARSANPFFVKEADGDADFKKSDYHLKAGSPARGSGKALPTDVAKAIDPSGTTVKPNAAVDRGALVNPMMKAQ